MLALRYEDGSEQVLVLTDLLTGRSYGIDEADLTEPVREWIKRTTTDRVRGQRMAHVGSDEETDASAV